MLMWGCSLSGVVNFYMSVSARKEPEILLTTFVFYYGERVYVPVKNQGYTERATFRVINHSQIFLLMLWKTFLNSFVSNVVWMKWWSTYSVHIFLSAAGDLGRWHLFFEWFVRWSVFRMQHKLFKDFGLTVSSMSHESCAEGLTGTTPAL